MNTQFKQFVTSTAFNLSLSAAMIEYLLLVDLKERRLREEGLDPKTTDSPEAYNVAGFSPAIAHSHFLTTGRALIRRGLLEKVAYTNKRGAEQLITVLTEEGRLIAQLLRRAGFRSSVEESEASFTNASQALHTADLS